MHAHATKWNATWGAIRWSGPPSRRAGPHQIRVHMAYTGHPLVGDPVYGKRTLHEAEKLGLERQFLHAHKLGFTLPSSGEWRALPTPQPSCACRGGHEPMEHQSHRCCLGCPSTRAMYSFCVVRAAICRVNASCADLRLATTNNPLVSLSSLCTIPGRASSPISSSRLGTWASNAFTSVPLACPGAGCTTMPAGFRPPPGRRPRRLLSAEYARPSGSQATGQVCSPLLYLLPSG